MDLSRTFCGPYIHSVTVSCTRACVCERERERVKSTSSLAKVQRIEFFGFFFFFQIILSGCGHLWAKLCGSDRVRVPKNVFPNFTDSTNSKLLTEAVSIFGAIFHVEAQRALQRTAQMLP